MNELDWKMFFDGWAPIVRTFLLGSLAYVALVALLRISGKRTLSKMNAFDFVVTVAFGSTLAAILTSKDVSLLQGVSALGLLILLQFTSTFMAARFDWFQSLIKAQPTLLYFKGQFLTDVMRQQRVTKEEIIAAIRQYGSAKPSEVGAVVIETEGSLAVMDSHASSVEALSGLGIEVQKQPGNRDEI